MERKEGNRLARVAATFTSRHKRTRLRVCHHNPVVSEFGASIDASNPAIGDMSSLVTCVLLSTVGVWRRATAPKGTQPGRSCVIFESDGFDHSVTRYRWLSGLIPHMWTVLHV
jgi:hypothetical protein